MNDPTDAPTATRPPRRMGRTLALGALLLALLLAGAGLWRAWAPERSVESLQARWAAAPSRFVAVDGLNVHLRDEGPRDDALPIVLLHGTSASLHTWDGWAAALRAERRVIRMDLPGFGLTGPRADDDYSIAAYVRFVLRLLDGLGVERFVVAGNSLGGEIAWRTAVAAPQRVAALVLVDAAGYAFAPESVPIGFRLARLPVARELFTRVLPRGIVEESLRNVYGDPARVDEALVERYYELALRAGNRRALVQRFAQLDNGAAAAQIPLVAVPTLILWGGQDRLIPPAYGQAFARDIRGSRLVLYDALGHVPHEEDPARTAADVRRFLGMAPAAGGGP